MDLFSMEPMRYWAHSSSMTKEEFRHKLQKMIDSKKYLWSRKWDGNWSRAIITKERSALQTRGISKATGTYGEVQDKVFFWNNVVNAFSDTTIILGEIYLPEGVDKDVGSILRSKEDKAKSIQDADYYYNCGAKFTAKDRRDIEKNKFFNTNLRWRIFDVLYYEGENLIDKPCEERFKYFDKVIEKIGSPLVEVNPIHEMNENFFYDMEKIFSEGGEGAVCYLKEGVYQPGKRTAWLTCKVKQEISNDIDCFIIGKVPCERLYNGKNLENWTLWQDIRSGEFIEDDLFNAYCLGNSPYEPVSKNYFNGWCGAISVGVYDKDGKIYHLCDVSGLDEDFKNELRDNWDTYYMTPIKISGMAVSIDEETGSVSIRHPKLISIREQDIDLKDCNLKKVLEQNML